VARPISKKGKLGKRVDFIRQLIREVTGLAPYEKRIVELLKVGGSKETKKALKVAKSRLGTHRRGLKKRELLEEYVRQQRKKKE
jgi:large subunit ribosomal protein L36e